MKKRITLAAIFAVSALTAVNLANAEEPAVPQADQKEAAMPAPEAQKPVFGQQAVELGRNASERMTRERGREGQPRGDNRAMPMLKMTAAPQHDGFKPQGFIDPNAIAKNTKAALDAKDRSLVNLEGNITKQVNDTEYTFVDSTGQIKIDIAPHAWRGLAVGPQDKVRIEGVLDKQWEQPEVKVKHIAKAK